MPLRTTSFVVYADCQEPAGCSTTECEKTGRSDGGRAPLSSSFFEGNDRLRSQFEGRVYGLLSSRIFWSASSIASIMKNPWARTATRELCARYCIRKLRKLCIKPQNRLTPALTAKGANLLLKTLVLSVRAALYRATVIWKKTLQTL